MEKVENHWFIALTCQVKEIVLKKAEILSLLAKGSERFWFDYMFITTRNMNNAFDKKRRIPV